jgi:hypothetical protein
LFWRRILPCCQRPGYMRLGVVSDPLWIYQLESMIKGKTKLSICCGCHGWCIIALLAFRWFSFQYFFIVSMQTDKDFTPCLF